MARHDRSTGFEVPGTTGRLLGLALLVAGCGGGGGGGAPLPSAEPGDLVITEVMVDARGNDTGDEWLEIYNASQRPIPLDGLVLATERAGEEHTIHAPSLVVASGTYAVLAQDQTGSGALPGLVDYAYGRDVRFSNQGGAVRLLRGATLLDEVVYDPASGWPIREAEAMALDPRDRSAQANDDPLAWSYARSALAADPGQRGTPGAENGRVPMRGVAARLVDDQAAYAADQDAVLEMRLALDPQDLSDLQGSPTSGRAFPVHFESDGVGTGTSTPNGTIEVRGQTSRLAPQLSFKVKLQGISFRGQDTLHLNKHAFDLTRLRNHLSFRLLRGVRDMVSLRTQLVHLFVNGQDFGLFTQVESTGRRFLRAHGLDDRGTLFKADDFQFLPLTAPELASGRVNGLDRKVGASDQGMIALLTELHQTSDFSAFFAAHLERENFLSFLATALLVDQLDSRNQNVFLYAPPDEPARFYLFHWDLDGTLGFHDFETLRGAEPQPRWTEGFSNWWELPLVQRFLQVPANRVALFDRVDELVRGPLAATPVDALVSQIDALVAPFLARSPDQDPGNLPSGDRQAEVQAIASDPAARQALALQAIERPMPVFSDVTYVDATTYDLTWDPSVDLQGDAVTYELVFSESRRFSSSTIALSFPGLTGLSSRLTAADLAPLGAGSHYWLLRIRDAGGHLQTAFNELDPKTVVVPGIASAVAGPSAVRVTWPTPLGMTVAGYALYQKTTPFGLPNLSGATRTVLQPLGADPNVAIVTGLPAGQTQHLLIRAFDAGLHEEQNRNVVTSTPYAAAISIDGALADWAAVPPATQDPADVPDSSGPDFQTVWVTDSTSTLFIRFQSENPFNLDGSPSSSFSRLQVYIDADRDATTGFSVAVGGGATIGSELLLEGGELFGQSAASFNTGSLGPISAQPTTAVTDIELAIPIARIQAVAPGTRRVRLVFWNSEVQDRVPDQGALDVTLFSP